jgi:hypothetical protein
MSELVNTACDERDFRWHLLSTVCAVALFASASGAIASDEAEHPVMWIELGGQFERVDTPETLFAPLFVTKAEPDFSDPMLGAQRAPRFSVGGEAKLVFAPEDTNWIFSASVRYGRSNAAKHLHYQSSHKTTQTHFSHLVTENGRPLERYGDGQSKSNSSHLALDFLAGKDVGLGLFGTGGSSILSAGIRFAQFTSSGDITLHARPIYRSGPFITKPPPYPFHFHGAYFQTNRAFIQLKHSTEAVGPTLSWDASVPVVRTDTSVALALDWGANAAILFGRQRTKMHHQTKSSYFYVYPGGQGQYASRLHGYTNTPPDRNGARNVTIPNVGGFAGMSLKFPNAKVSVGYRADFFFGAVDNGIDTRKSQNVGFYGPFATIDVGLGG